MYWKNTKKILNNRFFLAILPVIAVACVINITGFGHFDQASALTAAQNKQCYDTLNGTESNPNNPTFTDIANKGLLASCEGAGICKTAGIGSTGIGSVMISCTNIAAASSAAVVAPLIKAVCGNAPALIMQGAQSPYTVCVNKVTADYQACSAAAAGNAALNTVPNVARCFVASNPSMSVAAASAAITQGRAAGDAITNAPANAAAKKVCEDGGGTFNASNVCVPKNTKATGNPQILIISK